MRWVYSIIHPWFAAPAPYASLSNIRLYIGYDNDLTCLHIPPGIYGYLHPGQYILNEIVTICKHITLKWKPKFTKMLNDFIQFSIRSQWFINCYKLMSIMTSLDSVFPESLILLTWRGNNEYSNYQLLVIIKYSITVWILLQHFLPVVFSSLHPFLPVVFSSLHPFLSVVISCLHPFLPHLHTHSP